MKCEAGCYCGRHTRSGNPNGYSGPHSEETKRKLSAITKEQMRDSVRREASARGGRWWAGRIRDPAEWTPERRAKVAESAAKNHAAGVYRRSPTSLERTLYDLLEGAGYQVERQVRFGRYVVDAWLPEERLVFEADGMFWFWHQDAEREARRDAYLLAHGAVAVVHLTDEDLK